MVQGTLFGKATRVVGQDASVHPGLVKRGGACASCLELSHDLGPFVPRNERDACQDSSSVTVFTVYGRFSHLGRAVTAWRGVW